MFLSFIFLKLFINAPEENTYKAGEKHVGFLFSWLEPNREEE